MGSIQTLITGVCVGGARDGTSRPVNDVNMSVEHPGTTTKKTE